MLCIHVYVCVCMFEDIKAWVTYEPRPHVTHVAGEKTEFVNGNSKKMVTLDLHLLNVVVSKL